VNRVAVLLLALAVPARGQDAYDLVVYGATAGGVARAARSAFGASNRRRRAPRDLEEGSELTD